MENVPYIQSEVPDNQEILNNKLKTKVSYLENVATALNQGNDRRIYELIDSKKYNELIRGVEHADSNHALSSLVADLQADLNHHLGQQLISYLSEAFPFFYYQESNLGVFELYFGNWWDRAYFGRLDPINVQFKFKAEEYDKLVQSVKLAAQGERYHAAEINALTEKNEALQKLVDTQNDRNAQRKQLEHRLDELEDKGGFFNRTASEEEQAEVKQQLQQLDATDQQVSEVPKQIEANNAQILEYSKEDTILIYEQRAINEQFGSFDQFNAKVEALYVDYVKHLAEQDGGLADA